MRLSRPSARLVQGLALADLVANVAIVVTGAGVRLTASGLGCPTWPRCTPDSLVVQGEAGLHGLVEFGNRILGTAVVLIGLLTLLAVVRMRPRPAGLLRPAALVLVGVAAQVVLGGITVLTGLHPLTVAAHFLVSMAILVAAVVLVERSGREADGVSGAPMAAPVLWLGRALVAAAAVVVALGTLVTGSGPHSGDAYAQRLDLDPDVISQVHADAVFLFLGLAVAAVVTVRLVPTTRTARRRSVVLVGVLCLQAAIGYTQYFTGLPVPLVAAHVLGACLVWVAVLRLHLGLARSDPGDAAAPAVAPQDRSLVDA